MSSFSALNMNKLSVSFPLLRYQNAFLGFKLQQVFLLQIKIINLHQILNASCLHSPPLFYQLPCFFVL